MLTMLWQSKQIQVYHFDTTCIYTAQECSDTSRFILDNTIADASSKSFQHTVEDVFSCHLFQILKHARKEKKKKILMI